MSKASTLNRQKQSNSAEGNEAREEEAATMKEIHKCIETCRGMYYHRLLSGVTRDSYEGMFEEVLQKKRLDWAESNIGFLEKTIAKAEAEERNMLDQLEREKHGRFNERDMRELHEWFQDDSLPEMTRSKLLDQKVSEFVAKFDVMARKRLALLSRLEELSDQDAQDLATLRSPEAFFSMDASARKNMMDRMEALDMASLKGKKKLYSDTKTLLDEAADGEDRYLSPTVSGTMLRQMIASDKPEQHHKETLLPSLRTYKDTRVSFDALLMELSGSDDAPIEPPSIDAFVKWNTGKRTSFIAEGRRRMEAQRSSREEQEEELARSKRTSEKLLRAEDWKAADDSIHAGLHRFPEDADLKIMEAFLHEHRTDTEDAKEERELDRTAAEIDGILASVHPEMRTLYLAMLMEGADVFQTFAESMQRGAMEVKKETDEKTVDAGEPEEEEGVVDAGDSTDDQLEVVDAVVHGEEREKALTVAAISADTQARYGRQLNEQLEARLRRLEQGGRKYGKAA